MGETNFDLEKYLTAGVERIVAGMVKAAAFHPRESLFMAKYAASAKKAARLRREAEDRGEHVPPFLIASVTSLCNLHCAGCYARSLDTCCDGGKADPMSAEDWGNVFSQAAEMGVGFILLAGGEPMVRRDVMETAAKFPSLLFPVFTNGTMIDDKYMELLDQSRNIVPMISLEGGETVTDSRRGKGMYARIRGVMEELSRRRIAFGASVTVTKDNLREVTSDEFIGELKDAGCKGIVFVEFVPTEESMRSQALGDSEREELARVLAQKRAKDDSMLMISFPGDEKSSGGCLAAGRGFFHINPAGGAEPCPFSPYSDINVKEHTLREVMETKLFADLREGGYLKEEHDGGCVLYEKRRQVEALLHD